MFKILIHSPGGRYGELPDKMWYRIGKSAAQFKTVADAEKWIDAVKQTRGYKSIPPQFRPTYEIKKAY